MLVGDRKKTGRAALRLGAAALGLALTLGMPGLARAGEVEFFATTDKDEVTVDDTLTLSVTVGVEAGSGESEELKLPDAPDFEVLSRTQSVQTSFAMGHGGPPTFRKVRVFNLILQPRRMGTFTIRSGRLVFRGKTYETGALRVKVSGPGGSSGGRRHGTSPTPTPTPPVVPPIDPNNPFGNLGNLFGGDEDPDSQDLLEQFFGSSRPTSDTDLYLGTLLDKRQAYLGEQVTFSTYLFSRVDITGVDGFKMPKLDGFWAEDIETPQQITGEMKMIDGVPYRVFLLRRRALFPIRSGRLTIDPVEVDVATGFGFQIHGGKVHRSSRPMALEVLPLPAGAPAGFEPPNVGQWRLAAEAAPTTTQLGQPITLKLTLEGTGNLHDVVLPRLPAIPGLKSYDPTITEKTSIAKGRFGGRRVLEYLLMPEQTGNFEVPALTLHYFDPDPNKRVYLESSTRAIALRVEGGTGTVDPGRAPQGPPGIHNVLDAGGWRPLRYKAELARPTLPVYRRPFFLPMALAPFALWVFLLALGLVRATLAPSAEGRQRGLAGKARKRLRTARSLVKAKKPDDFYAEVSRAFVDYLSARLATPVAGLTRADLTAQLAAAGLEPELAARLCAVLDTCDAGRFAPGGSTSQSMARLLAEALSVMEETEGARLTVAKPAPKEVPA